MKIRTLLATSVVAAVTLVGGPSVAAPAPVGDGAVSVVVAKKPCTKTSSGTCIKGGQFCPQASYGKSGWDAAGRRWVCKGDKVHPHWLKP
ncbi:MULTISPECIES: hypothetical protein [unclassified Nocardioides]|uniref:hypothetical protein n=1 Tax=unclassified Nocardioides TaxID=2615069 RepID=UPI0026668B6F|nr:hypothetical protein [Nocardioides sp. Arc9.136]WKN47910.1 hypothetical protein OSR43_17955 [Nocardioides sp. Arc9.136]